MIRRGKSNWKTRSCVEILFQRLLNYRLEYRRANIQWMFISGVRGTAPPAAQFRYFLVSRFSDLLPLCDERHQTRHGYREKRFDPDAAALTKLVPQPRLTPKPIGSCDRPSDQ